MTKKHREEVELAQVDLDAAMVCGHLECVEDAAMSLLIAA
jgi:hypothetical protein